MRCAARHSGKLSVVGLFDEDTFFLSHLDDNAYASARLTVYVDTVERFSCFERFCNGISSDDVVGGHILVIAVKAIAAEASAVGTSAVIAAFGTVVSAAGSIGMISASAVTVRLIFIGSVFIEIRHC